MLPFDEAWSGLWTGDGWLAEADPGGARASLVLSVFGHRKRRRLWQTNRGEIQLTARVTAHSAPEVNVSACLSRGNKNQALGTPM